MCIRDRGPDSPGEGLRKADSPERRTPLTAVGGRLGAVLVAALELFSLTPLLTADAFGFLLAAAAAGWGGLSVLCQTLAVLEGSGLRLRNRCV